MARRQKDSTLKNIAKGAAGMAAVVGVVAAGAALSDKRTRKNFGKGVGKVIIGMQTVTKNIEHMSGGRYQVVGHRITGKRKVGRRKNAKKG